MSRLPQARISTVALPLLLLAISLPAAATLRTIEQAYELAPGQLQLPGTASGQLTAHPCATCRPVNLRVTAATSWFVGAGTKLAAGQAAVLAALRAATGNPGTLVYVYYEPQTRRVKRIVLDAPPPALPGGQR